MRSGMVEGARFNVDIRRALLMVRAVVMHEWRRDGDDNYLNGSTRLASQRVSSATNCIGFVANAECYQVCVARTSGCGGPAISYYP